MCGTVPKMHAPTRTDGGMPLCGQMGAVPARSLQFFWSYVPLGVGSRALSNTSWRCKNCEKILAKQNMPA